MTDTSLEKPALLKAGNGFSTQASIAFLLTALADWLFFDHYLGINVTLFALCVCLGMMLSNGVRKRRMLVPASLVLAVAIAPTVEMLSISSFLFALAGVVFFVLAISIERSRGLRDWLDQAILLTVGGPILLFMDAGRCKVEAARNGSLTKFKGRVSIWILPLLFGGLFIWLFAAANPVIDEILHSLRFETTGDGIQITRIAFWLATLSVIWSFIRVRITNRQRETSAGDPATEPVWWNVVVRLFPTESILISLVAFNLIFAVQTTLDMTYLWAGVALPDGMTYAEYARRGTYPLMAAALLSAAFVLVALRPGTRAERTPVIRLMVFPLAWSECASGIRGGTAPESVFGGLCADLAAHNRLYLHLARRRRACSHNHPHRPASHEPVADHCKHDCRHRNALLLQPGRHRAVHRPPQRQVQP